MLLRTSGLDEIVIGECSPARLLLKQYLIVKLKIIHTTLKSKHLRHKRRFDHPFPRIEPGYHGWQIHSQGLGDVAFLILCFRMEILINSCRQEVNCMSLEEILYTLVIGMGIRQLVNFLIEQLAGKITKFNSLTGFYRLYLLYQIYKRRICIIGKATCYC